MKIKYLNIGTQLRIALGAIVIFVLILGAASWFLSDSLWKQTENLYHHPLTVRRAIGELKADLLIMQRGMRDLILASNENERQTALQEIDTHEANAARQLEVIYRSYLGPRKDIDEVQNSYAQWKTMRVESIRLLRAGKTAEAVARTKISGAGGAQFEKIMKEIDDISDFSLKKAETFYTAAQVDKTRMSVMAAILSFAILLLSVGIIHLLSQAIREPLEELTSAAEQYRQGNFDMRSRYPATNEFGTLSDAFNLLAATVQMEMRNKEKTALIADAMLGHEELMAFCSAMLPELIAGTESQMGAVYFLREEKKQFEPYYAIGLTQDRMRPFSAVVPEGEFGAALTTKTITRISAIPEDARFDFATVAGNFQPREIITIPVMQGEKVIALISLASLHTYAADALATINNAWKSLNIGIIGMLTFESIREYSRKLDMQNAQLEAQTTELQNQSNALRNKNEEIQAQSEEMQAQSIAVRQQSEELQLQNAELEQQRLALEEASRLKSQFLSNMSHELRTPLNSVMALSRVLTMQASSKLSAEEVNYLEIIERNGKNLLTLINDILDLAKIEAGRMDIHAKPFSLSQAIENIVESLTPLAEEKHIGMRQDVPDNLPLLESDEIRVSQILQNLLANAVKFTDAGSVTVSVTNDADRLFIRIADTGIGIAANNLPHIFDEFRQVDGTSARRHEGTGLGLAIARKAARMLGGEIAVTSALGEGSAFTLTLPIAWQGTAPAPEPVVVLPPSRIKSERKTILVVDDEPEMAAMISRYLRQEGYDTLTATSGVEALKLAASERPFAVTLDVIMPDMDGWEILQGLKQNPATRNIPVIIVSISEDRETGLALGAIGYVTKPVAKTQLMAEIKKISRPGTRAIMVVDDNDWERQQIRRIIEEEGLNTILAEDGAVCLELIKDQIPDVLVLDLMMPNMDGFAVLEKIRSNPDTRDLPVIVVTAKDLTEADRGKLRGNVVSVLEKSAAKSATLLTEVKRILLDLEDIRQRSGLEKPLRAPRILLVEDNEAATIQVKAVLEAAGFAADVARGGQEAFDYVSHTIPDGIILDLMMPEIDGFAVLEKIRSRTATAAIPVLILTAKDLTPEDLRKLSANNVRQLVQKGDVDRDSLLQKVCSMLGRPEPQGQLSDIAGKGETVAVHYPVSDDARRGTAMAPGARRILIVEDNPDNMTTIKAVLQNRYGILETTDGEAGLRAAAEEFPDLILLDMALPGMDGMTVVRHLKSNDMLRNIPVIALTAQAMKGDRETILAAGCDDYLAKPFDPDIFINKVEQWLKESLKG